MGLRGPAPTPTKVLRMRGSWRAKTRRREPQPAREAPPCPDWLDEDAKAAWQELIPQLRALGVLAVVDGRVLARYCHFWSRWRKAEAFIAEHGDAYPVRKVIKDEHGQDKVVALGFRPFPQAKFALELAEQLLKLERELGLSPAARTRLQIAVAGPATEEERWAARFFPSRAAT